MPRRIHTTIVVALILSSTAFAQNQAKYERIQAKLDRSKENYQAALTEAADAIISQLESRIEYSKKRGELDVAKNAEMQLEKFQGKGTLPTLASTRRYLTTTDRERLKLNVAYKKAIRDLSKAQLSDHAERVSMEYRAWRFPFSNGTDIFAEGSELTGHRKLTPKGIRHDLTLIVDGRTDTGFTGMLTLKAGKHVRRVRMRGVTNMRGQASITTARDGKFKQVFKGSIRGSEFVFTCSGLSDRGNKIEGSGMISPNSLNKPLD